MGVGAGERSGGRDPGSEGAGRRRGSPANLGGEEGGGVSGHLSEVLREGWKAALVSHWGEWTVAEPESPGLRTFQAEASQRSRSA